MPRYFFDVRDGGGFHPDEFGDEFDSFEEARQQCQALLPDIARDQLPDFERLDVSCDVRDAAGRVVYRGELIYKGTQF